EAGPPSRSGRRTRLPSGGPPGWQEGWSERVLPARTGRGTYTPSQEATMPEVTAPYAPGTPCWVDLAAPDQQAAIDFYSGLFGWTGQIGPPETGGYAVCELKGKPVAGIMAA